jgi:pimeloyl-ACP methyl ester carboxylesterase
VEVVRAYGLEIACERVGEGPPLVFVHGGATDGRLWPQLAALADEFAVVAWDEPGRAAPRMCPRTSAWRTTPTASRR